MSEPSKPSGVECFGGVSDVAEQPAEFHALQGPMRVLGLWYVRCSCSGDWVSEGKDTRAAALAEVCPFETSSVIAARNRYWLARSLRSAARVV